VDVGKGDGAIGDSITVVIGKNQESVTHLLEWLPFRVGLPGGHPQASARIHPQLNRIYQLGKHFLRCEQIGAQACGQLHLCEPLLSAQVTAIAELADPAL